MTSVPMNARSEFVTPTNPSGGGVCDTSLRFQIASAASWSPALSPTRGSGDGAVTSGADMSGPLEGLAASVTGVDELPPQPPITIDAMRKPVARSARTVLGEGTVGVRVM